MSVKEKLIERFKCLPKDFTFDEMSAMLRYFGYEQDNKGKTSGSRICFKHKNRPPIMLHKPHPGNIVKKYAMEQVLEALQNQGMI